MAFQITSPQSVGSIVTITRVAVLTLADATNFSVGGDFACDGDSNNNAVGTVISKSGNVVTLAVTSAAGSGQFVATNGIDNANPFVGDETTITSVDSEYFEIAYTKVNPQHNTISFCLDYTKDTETQTTVAMGKNDSDINTKYYFESIADSSNVAVRNSVIINASDLLELIFKISRSQENLKFIVTPQDMDSDGVMDIIISEDNFST